MKVNDCSVWYDPDVLMDIPDEEANYEWVRTFTWECILEEGHDGPHQLDVFVSPSAGEADYDEEGGRTDGLTKNEYQREASGR